MTNVAILRDGYSDFLVLRKFVKCIFESYRGEALTDEDFIDLDRLNITNPLQEYLHKTRRIGDYSYHTAEASSLISSLISIFYGCFRKMERETGALSNKMIVIVSADSERILKERNQYFNDWAYNIRGLLLFSIEKFYEHMRVQGHSIKFLPLITPLILFPSSEILVASCMFDLSKDNCRHLEANPALKEKVYGTSSIPEAIESGNLEEVLDMCFTADNLEDIYKEIPEVRVLMHMLAI